MDIVFGHKQHMWIMNIVWPITALYSGPLGLIAYFRVGRQSTARKVPASKKRGKKRTGKEKPFWQTAGVGTTHCGSGCALGDICAEWLMFFFPLAIAGHKIFGAWLIDFAFAYTFGIAFQYFAIKPMRNYSFREGLIAAVKADTLSLTAWQIGMYGWMAITTFVIFGRELEPTDPTFWFMMQIAMLFGFLTSYPVNWWLIRKGIKEAM